MQDVIDAWRASTEAEALQREAEERYRETVRAALADGVTQSAIAKALDRTREMIRRDAMTDEQRAEYRRAVAERARRGRASRKDQTQM